MAQQDGNWENIQLALLDTGAGELNALLEHTQVSYDGMYAIAADEEVYSKLCQYYPLIETVAQDVAGARVRLEAGKSVPMGTGNDAVQLEAGAANVSEAIIRPESIVAVPAYLLRFVPYVGAAPVLLAVALRQAFYRATREHGANQLYPNAGDEVTIEVAGLLRSLGEVMSRAKFFRLFKEGRMDWFVARAEAEHSFKDGRIQRLPNTYQYRGQLLTPGDANDLYQWLLEHKISTEPVETLKKALSLGRDKLLSFPFRTPMADDLPQFSQAMSVHVVVAMALGVKSLSPEVAGLCDNLSSHLIRPESFLAIPWYWFHKVLPELGDDLGVLYLMCKNCCFVDWAHGQDRNTFWVQGGLSTLQAWIGSETLPKRIPHKDPSLRGRPRQEEVKDNSEYVRSWRDEKRNLAGAYLCRIDARASAHGQDWQLEVSDTQLVDHDQALKTAMYEFIQLADNPELGTALVSVLQDKPAQSLLLRAGKNCQDNQICHFETLVNQGICHSETLESAQISHFDTLVDALNCHFETLTAPQLCHFDTIIYILIKLKNTFKASLDTQPPYTSPDQGLDTPPEDEKQVVGGLFDDHYWDLEGILSRVNPVLAKQIQQRTKPAAFISWLIYAALTSSIKSPLSFAVSRTLETLQDAGGPALRLAMEKPQNLAEQVWTASQRLGGGYLGGGMTMLGVSPDLQTFLNAEHNLQAQLSLLQRLMDSLGIHQQEGD